MSSTPSKRPIFALVDCNNFFVSCERTFNPKLNGKPVVVLSNNDGCVIARSNEAKTLGITMGVPLFKIKALCAHKQVIYLSSNYGLYGDMSTRVMRLLEKACPDIALYSIDEAFIRLDNMPVDPEQFCQTLGDNVLRSTGIPLSIGIAHSKTLAKVANQLAKQRGNGGVYSLLETTLSDPILAQFPIGDIWGIGHANGEKLANMQIRTIADFVALPPYLIKKLFSVHGERIQRELQGVPCLTLDVMTDKKSITASRSFGKPVTELHELQEAIANYAVRACKKLRAQHSRACVIQVYLRTNHHKRHHKQHADQATIQLQYPTADTGEIIKVSKSAMAQLYKPGYQYKKCGITLLDLTKAQHCQQDLFTDIDYQHSDKRMQLIDSLNARLGANTIFYGAQGITRDWQMQSNHRTPCYTTAWSDILVVD